MPERYVSLSIYHPGWCGAGAVGRGAVTKSRGREGEVGALASHIPARCLLSQREAQPRAGGRQNDSAEFSQRGSGQPGREPRHFGSAVPRCIALPMSGEALEQPGQAPSRRQLLCFWSGTLAAGLQFHASRYKNTGG